MYIKPRPKGKGLKKSPEGMPGRKTISLGVDKCIGGQDMREAHQVVMHNNRGRKRRFEQELRVRPAEKYVHRVYSHIMHGPYDIYMRIAGFATRDEMRLVTCESTQNGIQLVYMGEMK
eukprot:878740-Amorphochlora_amoeboformis.AAC.1